MNKIKLMKSVMGVVEEVSHLLAPRFSLPAHSSSLLLPRSPLFPPRSNLLALLLTLLTATTAEAAHIKETLTLAKGWNGVYLESTPDVASCAEFFKDLPVTKVMLYDGKGLDGAPLIDESGRDILQPPVYYTTWNAAAPDAGTLKSLVGGRCYLIYATEAATKEFAGVPQPPHAYWRATGAAEGPLNLVGVSRSASQKVTAKTYFGEGLYDGGKVYVVGGTDQGNPTMKQLLGTAPEVANGTAYSLSATGGGTWPGVITVDGDSLLIANGSGSLKLSNTGSAARTFRLTMVKSADPTEEFPPLLRELPRTSIAEDPGYDDVVAGESWDVEMPLGGSANLVLKTAPANMATGVTYAAVLQVEDLGASAMRVRVPVTVLGEKNGSFGGLWVGAMALGAVSSIDGAKQPFPAAGIMSLNVIVHVDSNNKSRLLQRAVVAGTNDVQSDYRVFTDLSEPWQAKYRFFTGMMSVDAPCAVETNGTFGTEEDLVFTWGVPERAKDNPFRHAWHPDHDGLSADYTMPSPSGDDPTNYGNPVKPELWSITNTLSFKFDQQSRENAGETMAGAVVWDVGGLVSTNTIRSAGAFTLRRVVKGVEFVK